jgi:hypothetical protein
MKCGVTPTVISNHSNKQKIMARTDIDDQYLTQFD